MGINLDTFLALALIYIGAILWTHMKANDKNHERLREELGRLASINHGTAESISSIQRMIERRLTADNVKSRSS